MSVCMISSSSSLGVSLCYFSAVAVESFNDTVAGAAARNIQGRAFQYSQVAVEVTLQCMSFGCVMNAHASTCNQQASESASAIAQAEAQARARPL